MATWFPVGLPPGALQGDFDRRSRLTCTADLPCEIQRVDPESRRVVDRRPYGVPCSRVQSFSPDPFLPRTLVLGVHTETEPFGTPLAYSVRILTY